MINIVIPMAGRGSRFAQAGYQMPKPLIDVHGKPMIEYVTRNITPKEEHTFIYLCLQEHLEKYHLEKFLKTMKPGCVVLPVDHVTEGAACTVLIAESYINNEDKLMIANSDQYVTVDMDDYIQKMEDMDGLIMTMYANDPKWSFINYDANGYVTMVREKEVISNEATVGIYNFAKGSDYVKYANQMIRKNIRVNDEFYVAPVYNEMIQDRKKIAYYNIGSEGNGMYGLGIPEDLDKFLSEPISRL